MKKGDKGQSLEERTRAVQDQTIDLLREHQGALSFFDKLPVSKDGTQEWEEVLVGPEADFPIHIEGLKSPVEVIEEERVPEQNGKGTFFQFFVGVFRKEK